MKFKSIFITSALALSCGSLQAQVTAPPRAELFMNQQSTTELIGTDVWNFQNEKLGKVKFITADLENARLVEVVISSGGFLGIGGKITSAPPRALSLDPHKQILRLDVSKARFDAAPNFKVSDVESYSNPGRVAGVLRYFGLQPWFYLDGQVPTKNAEILRLGTVRRTGYILGLEIKSTSGQYLGKVASLLINLPKGQIVHVVDETQAMGDNDTIILQPRALRYNSARNGLVLNENLAALKKEPHLKWIAGTRESYEQERYVNRGVHTPQGANFRDVQKTGKINQGVQSTSNANNVQVTTLNAQTTLRGRVNSVAEKDKIGEIARQAGRPENVSNQIEVRSAGGTR